MNILSHEQMLLKEKQLLQLYNHGDIKFKLNLPELIQYKTNKKDFFCFTKPNQITQKILQKVVPLHKNVKMLKLEEEQNALFKVLAYIFLLMIYKQKDQSSQYFKQHLKCSLYSPDFDLLEIRNHSFNKKMRSDTIKGVIATLFKEIQYFMQTEIVKINKIKPQQLIAFVLQQNDIVVEGFHLFYRSILVRLDVQNAINCLEDVNPQQAIENLIEYFELDCRIFNNLYFFNEVGIFITIINEDTIAFGRYYENEINFEQTSQEQIQSDTTSKNIQEIQFNLPRKLLASQEQIQKNDVKIFNFILDTDRNSSSCMEESLLDDKSIENVTPSFQHNDQLKFGKKSQRSIDSNLHKIKDRIQNQRINQISSQEEQIQVRQEISQSFNGNFNNTATSETNKFLNFKIDDSKTVSETDCAATPILGGNQNFRFGKINAPPKIPLFQEDYQYEDFKESRNDNGNVGQKNKKARNNALLLQTKDIKQSAVRRQSYQEGNSSQSKSSENIKKPEMKTSKNQIKVIDQTASRASLVNHQQDSKIPEQIINARKVTMAHCQQTSSYSNCTCHFEKKARFKLSSQIITMTVNVTNQNNNQSLQNFGRNVPHEMKLKSEKKINLSVLENQHKKALFKTQAIKSSENLNVHNGKKEEKSPLKEHKQHQKSQQFINFLKKDKKQLLKKLTQKRNAKQQIGSGEINLRKLPENSNKNNEGQKKFVKQSMFVGSYNFQNPQKVTNNRRDKNLSISPHFSKDKHKKKGQQVRERSRTPNGPNGQGGRNQFKFQSSKNGTQIGYKKGQHHHNRSKQKSVKITEYLSQGCIPQQKVNSIIVPNKPKPTFSIKPPASQLNPQIPNQTFKQTQFKGKTFIS